MRAAVPRDNFVWWHEKWHLIRQRGESRREEVGRGRKAGERSREGGI